MSIISSLQNLAGSVRVQPARNGVQGLPQFSAIADVQRGDLLQARGRLLRIQQALETLAELTNVSTRFKLDLPDARSAQSLGLDLTNTASTLASNGEINASPMSFSPFGPEWGGASTAAITIGGEYNGAHGSGLLTFEVRRPGIKGVDNLRIRIEDPQGNRIKNINIRRNDDPNQQYSLDNGLYLTLGSGFLIDREVATIEVFDNVGSAVDPSKPLGGMRNDNPNLQFGTPAIVDGSFQINGQNIAVNTTDSLNDIVSRINVSGAGVTAVFNPTTEKIEFVQDTLGSVPTIDIQGDTSNFIESTKLDSAVVNPGIDPETVKAFANVAAFSTVQSGDILINGTAIAVDSANDSLTNVLDRINSSSAGVTASFDPGTQQVVIVAEESASELNIDSNGTGFFAALKIGEGRVDPDALSRGISRKRSYEIADALETLSSELGILMRDGSFSGGATNASLFRSPLSGTLNSAFAGAEQLFGFKIDDSSNALRRGDYATVDRRVFTQSLQLRGNDVKSFFAGDDGNSGLIGRLFSATQQALANVSYGLGQSGTYVDTYA